MKEAGTKSGNRAQAEQYNHDGANLAHRPAQGWANRDTAMVLNAAWVMCSTVYIG